VNKKTVLTSILVLSIASLPVVGQVVTIDANNFTAGQDVTNATAGVQLFAMTTVLNPNPTFNGNMYTPVFGSVYAQPVTAGCEFFGATCSVNGNLTFGFTQTTQPSSSPVLWNETQAAANCLGADCDGLSGGILTTFPTFVAEFSTPTNSVSALLLYGETPPSGIIALNAMGQVVGTCVGFPNGQRGSTSTCSSTYAIDSPTAGWGSYTITSSSADITYLLAASPADDRGVGQIQFFSVPEPDSLALFAAAGLGLLVFRCRRVSK
jgi:hypothetical protein